MRARTPSPVPPSDHEASQREDPTPLPARPRLAVATPRPVLTSPALHSGPRAIGTPPIASSSQFADGTPPRQMTPQLATPPGHLEDRTPQFNDRSSQMNDRTPQFNDRSSQLNDRTHQFNDRSQQFDERTQPDDRAPQFDDRTPPHQVSPALQAASARPRSEAPPLQAAVATPRAASAQRSASGSTPPQNRPRRQSAEDERIESGEIVERRSLVIRSQPVPVVEWTETPTEITVAPVKPRARSSSSPRLAVLAGAVGFAALAIVLTLRSGPSSSKIAALESRADLLATTLDGDARAAIVRAEAIAASPVLRAAIDTDATTLADMARDRDMSLSLREHDVVEIYQVRAGKRALLLRLPATAAPLQAPVAGQARIDGAANRVVVVASAAIANGRSAVAGELVLSTPVDLVNITKRIAEQTDGAQLVGMQKPIVLEQSASAPNVTIPIEAKTPVAGSLSLAAFVPSGASSGSLWAWLCMTISAGLFATFVILQRRSRAA
jgi:hypothetical protein